MTRAIHRDDAGFTLVEVGLVAVIIGVLSGIAVPVFLKHADRAQTSAASTDIRSAATAMEAYFATEETYGPLSDVVSAGETPKLTPGTVIVLARHTGSAFCLAAIRNSPVPATEADLLAEAERWFDSAGGGLQAAGSAGCPVTTGFNAGWQGDAITAP